MNLAVAIVALCLAGAWAVRAMARRNDAVLEYRLHLIAMLCSAAADDDRNAEDGATCDSDWRLDQFNRVSFDQMMVQFWRPLSSFYDDLSFTLPSASREESP